MKIKTKFQQKLKLQFSIIIMELQYPLRRESTRIAISCKLPRQRWIPSADLAKTWWLRGNNSGNQSFRSRLELLACHHSFLITLLRRSKATSRCREWKVLTWIVEVISNRGNQQSTSWIRARPSIQSNSSRYLAVLAILLQMRIRLRDLSRSRAPSSHQSEMASKFQS